VFSSWCLLVSSTLICARGEETWEGLYRGIDYRKTRGARKVVIHQLRVNLEEPELVFLVTPPIEGGDHTNISKKTTRFLKDYGLQIAINGQAYAPGNIYFEGDPKRMHGIAAFDGQMYGKRRKEQYSFVVFKDRSADIIESEKLEEYEENIHMAISGWTTMGHTDVLVRDSAVNPYFLKDDLTRMYGTSRTIIGITKDKKTLYIVASEKEAGGVRGLTLRETAELMVELGCERAMNLDGGGSTTLAIEDSNGGAFIVNNLWGVEERAVANHLGIYAARLKD